MSYGGGRGYGRGEGGYGGGGYGGWSGDSGYGGGGRGGGGDYYDGGHHGGGGGRGGGRGGGGPTWQQGVVCKFFLQNRCSRGSSCWFIHPTGGSDGGAGDYVDAALAPAMSHLSMGGQPAADSASSWRRPPPSSTATSAQEEAITGPDLINTLPDRVLCRIFEMLGDNYIQLARLALVCRRWRSLSEDDAQCSAWRRAAESYYLYQNGSMKRAEGSWKAFFGMMIAFEEGMMGEAFDAYEDGQAWSELLDDYDNYPEHYEGAEGSYGYDPSYFEQEHEYGGQPPYGGAADDAWNDYHAQ